MTELSSRLSLPYLMPAQAQKHVTHNAALEQLDRIVQIVISDPSATVPPAEVAEGLIYALGQGASGAWAGHAGELAVRTSSGWDFVKPSKGWRAWDLKSATLLVFDGEVWKPAFDKTAMLGIGTTASADNPLSVSGANSLLTHAGTDHRLKINKANTTSTASIVFQSAWSGRAEIGLTGNNSLAFKVSANGAEWAEAVSMDPVRKAVSFAPAGSERVRFSETEARFDVPLTGTSVTSSSSDTTAGRVLRVGAGHLQLDPTLYHRGNIVGLVTQTGGAPTGALIETGTFVTGTYWRFAGGYQVCATTMTLTYEDAARLSASWRFPASFRHVPDSLSFTLSVGDQNASIPLDHYGAQHHSEMGLSSVKLFQYRIPGTTNFTARNSVEVRATVIGRWH